MKKAILITLILTATLVANGAKEIEVTLNSWVRLELNSLYGGYAFASQQIYVSFYNTDNPNVIRVAILWDRSMNPYVKAEAKARFLKMLEIYKVNSGNESWLQFDVIHRYLKDT